MFRTACRGSAVVAASAAVVCVATLAWSLAGTTASRGDTPAVGGYVFVGAADPGTPPRPQPTDGTVTLVPLDPSATAPGAVPGTPSAPVTASASRAARSTTSPSAAADRAVASASPRTGAPRAFPVRTGSHPAGPGRLTVDGWRRSPGHRRWCEKVSVTFVNSGTRAVTSGRVSFTAHIVDLLGLDWATRRTTADVPVPIAAGGRVTKTYGVCLDAWRVPPGTHVETRSVTLAP